MTEQTETPEGPQDDRMERLITLAERLVQEIDEFTKAGGEQFVSLAQRARTNRRLITLAIGSIILDLVITAVLSVGWVQVVNNDHRITGLTERLDVAQTVQRQKALCPLYQLLLDSKSAAGRKAAPDPVAYDHAFVVIESGYQALECSDFIKAQ